MRFRRRTCGLCKPTKRYKRRNRKREAFRTRDLLMESAVRSAKLREHHR